MRFWKFTAGILLAYLFIFLVFCVVWFFFFVLCLVFPVLPVSLGCSFVIAPSSCVLCVQCCQCLWVVHSWLHLRPVSCVSSVASVSGLFILDCTFVLCLVCPVLPVSLGCSFLTAPSSCVLCVQCCQCLWVVHSWLHIRPVSCVYSVASVSGLFIPDCTVVLCLVCPVLPVSLGCSFLIAPSSCVLCVQCCQCLWVVHSWLHLRPVFCVSSVASFSGLFILDCTFVLCPVLPVSLGCSFLLAPSSCVLCVQCCQCLSVVHSWLHLRPVSCVSSVASVSGLFILDCTFVLCLVCPLLPVSLGCLFLIAPSSCVQCCQCLWVVHSWLHLCPVSSVASVSVLFILDCTFVLCLVLPVSLDCSFLIAPLSCVLCVQCLWVVHSWLHLRPVSCVSSVASVSGLFILDCTFVLCFVCPVLPVSLGCSFLIAPLSCVLCVQCCQCLWVVHSWLHLRPVSCVSSVASVSGLFIPDCTFILCFVCPVLPVSLGCSFLIAPLSCVLRVQCCQCLWVVHSWLHLHPVFCVSSVASVSGLFILDCTFVLCFVCPVLPVSLGCSFLIAPSSCVLCVQCCQCLWVVHSWLHLRPVSCVSSVASVSGLFILDCTFVLCLVCPVLPESLGCSFLIAPSPCVQCCQCLWVVHSWLHLCPVSCVSSVASVSGLFILDCIFVLCFVCPVLPVSLGCSFLIAHSSFGLCVQCCQCLWVVHSWLHLCPVSCVSSVASVSGLFILDCTFVLCLVCPVLPVSLGCSFLIAPSSCVLCVQCCQCLWVVHSWLHLRPVSSVASVSGLFILDCTFVLCLACPVLPVSLGCSFLIASSSCVLCVQCCQCLWVVHSWLHIRPVFCVSSVASVSGLFILDCTFVLCFVCPVLPVSLGCSFSIAPSSCVLCVQCLWVVHSLLHLRPVFCVSSVASVSGLFILDCTFVLCLVCPVLPVSLGCSFLIAPSSCVLCVQCCQCLWVVHSWLHLRLVCQVLPVSLSCSFLIAHSSCVLCVQWCQCLWVVHS